MLLLQNVWIGEKGFWLSLYTHILKLLFLVLGPLLMMSFLHINFVITYNPSVLSTLSKIVPLLTFSFYLKCAVLILLSRIVCSPDQVYTCFLVKEWWIGK